MTTLDNRDGKMTFTPMYSKKKEVYKNWKLKKQIYKRIWRETEKYEIQYRINECMKVYVNLVFYIWISLIWFIYAHNDVKFPRNLIKQ